MGRWGRYDSVMATKRQTPKDAPAAEPEEKDAPAAEPKEKAPEVEPVALPSQRNSWKRSYASQVGW